MVGTESHDEVCRTISDTLAAEYSEYVTRYKITPYGQQHFQQSQQPTALDNVVNDSNYTSRVEFGLKLGYTETQVQIALLKLGPNAEQNDLLAELIKLGANASTNTNLSKSSAYSTGSGGSISECSITSDEHLSGDNYTATCEESCANLRSIVIDGSNVAMSHGNKETFSCVGIKVCVEWFRARGHKEITVFVPMWRKEASRPDAPIKDQEILFELEAERVLVFTPSRNVGGRRMVCYDDRYILKLASDTDGIVVSNDNYRDLLNENPEYKKVVAERLLMYSFVNDRFMPPDDPLGRHGPSLDNFLRKKPKAPEILPPPCPYGKKCTYGNKCKYYHPERGNQPQKTVTERLVENAKIQLQEVKSRVGNVALSAEKSRESSPGEKQRATHTGSLPPSFNASDISKTSKSKLSRTKSVISSHSSSLGTTGDCRSEPLFTGHWGGAASRKQMQRLTKSQSISKQNTEQGSDHLSIAKRLSDTDKPSFRITTNMEGEGENNLHRKLQRQLTLNPTYDPRLSQMAGYQKCLNKQDTLDTNYLLPVGSHRQLQRIGSDGSRFSNAHQQQQPPTSTSYLSSSPHHNVQRIASAPDSHSNWPPPTTQSLIARLNSTSDSRLILSPTPPPPSPFPGQTIWSSNVLPGLLVTPSSWSQGSSIGAVRPSSVPLQTGNKSVRSVSLANPIPSRPSSSSSSTMSSSFSPDSFASDPRYKLFFHLSSIFPEQQVRSAMELYPDETNAQRICAAILAMFPKG